MIIATLSSGHADLSDWLLLVAVVLFVLDVVLTYIAAKPARLALVSLGLASLALALFVA